MKKARSPLIRRQTAPQSEGGMRKAAAVDRRFRRAGRSPSSDLFLGRWTSPHSQKLTSRHFIVSANQRAFALTHRPKAGRFTLYGHRRTAGKEEVVFYRGQNYCFYFEQTQFYERKVSTQSKKDNIEAKQVDFLSNSPYFSPKPRSFSGKADIRRPSLLAPRFPTRTDTPERTRAHAHRALSEFAFLAFTLHLHPQHPDYQKE